MDALVRRCCSRVRPALLILAAAGLLAGVAAAEAGPDGETDPARRRKAVLDLMRDRPENSLDLLAGALRDDNPVVRRTAVRGLHELGQPARGVLVNALEDSDPEVRLLAFRALGDLEALTRDQIAAALGDAGNPRLRRAAVEQAARWPDAGQRKALLESASGDADESVRTAVSRALYPFPFYRKAESVRETADEVVSVTASFPLPAAGWKLKFDPGQNGHAEPTRWFDPGLDDADWADVEIGRFWDAFGLERRTGIGWYRGRFKLPARPLLSAVELCFEAVDESAWVWVNGEYAGQHDLGQAGWKTPFCLDVTPFLRWAAENHIAVRVLNTAEAGGIWKPVRLDVIKVGR